MDIIIRTDDMLLTSVDKSWIISHLESSFSTFSHEVDRTVIELAAFEAKNCPEHISDLRCRITVDLLPGGEFLTQGRNLELMTALDDAVLQAKSLIRKYHKRRWHRLVPRLRTALPAAVH